MTKKRSLGYPRDVNEALKLLYGNGVRDLTSEGYRKAMEPIRLYDKSLARRVERILNPILKKRFFPRRQREWYETSEATQVRLALLPGNPHVQADVSTVREVLRIPPGHIHTTPEHLLWKQLQDIMEPQRVRRVVEGNLVGEWLHIHRKTASGRTIEEEDSQILSIDMRESAILSARADLQASEVPEWLCRPTGEPGSHKGLDAPIDRAAGRLIERHNLPWHALTAVTMFILTQDHSWIEGLEPLRIDITRSRDPSGDPEAFSISVKNIDEFTTKEDWDRVWTNHVKPRQEFLWEKRGMSPQGRRTRDIERFKKALPFYRKMVEANLDFKDLYHSREVFVDEATLNWDMENLRRAIGDLDKILTPRP